MELLKRLWKLQPLMDAIHNEVLREQLIFMWNDLEYPDSYFQRVLPRIEVVTASQAPAGRKMHHTYCGGLLDHLHEMWKYALISLDNFPFTREFTLEELAVAILLHDLSKTIAYRDTGRGYEYREDFFKNMSFDHTTYFMLNHYRVQVPRESFLGIMFAEGGWSEAAKQKLQHNKLGAFVHVCDMYSSQLVGKRD